MLDRNHDNHNKRESKLILLTVQVLCTLNKDK